MALAPRRDLFGVPSRSIINSSMATCSGFQAGEAVEDFAFDGFHRLFDALAAVAALIAVAQLDRLMRAGGGAGRNSRTAQRPGIQDHIHFDGRVAPAVQNFPGNDVGDNGHFSDPLLQCKMNYDKRLWQATTASALDRSRE